MLHKIGEKVELFAPAKVNLALYVLGKRADGYHELLTHMQKIALYDRISVKVVEGSGVSFSCNDPFLPVDGNNLVCRAVDAFCKNSTRVGSQGVQVHLEKYIPVAAGLGGGSSDAGTVLRGLNTLFEDEFSEQDLIEMATPLGADVPLFASNMNAVLARGIGEIMEPVPSLTGYSLVLVNPDFGVSTRDVFENFVLESSQKEIPSILGEDGRFNLSVLHNDLEKVTIGMHPKIGEIKKSLRDLGASFTLMAGSGPTVFGLFRSEGESHRFTHIQEQLVREYGHKVFVVDAI